MMRLLPENVVQTKDPYLQKHVKKLESLPYT